MAKDPAVLFYTSDFLTGTTFMTNEEVGIYIRLLCFQHQHGGYIDKDDFNSLVNGSMRIRKKFKESEEGFYNDRLLEESAKRNKFCESRRKNAQSTSKAYASHMENENENENKDVKEKQLINKKFEEIWKRYPSTVGKKGALKHFNASVNTLNDWDNINKAILNYKLSKRVKGGFIQNGSTWFNNWRDWIVMPENEKVYKNNRAKEEYVHFDGS